MNLINTFRYLRFASFTTETEEGRTEERYRKAFLSILANFISRICLMGVMILAIKWTVPYLGVERFGIWMTIAGFATMLSFLDLGIGNAITNRVAYAASLQAQDDLKKIISGGMGLLSVISIFLAIILVNVAFILPWPKLIKIKSMYLAEEVRMTAVVFCFLFSISILSNGISRIYHGLQRGFEVYIANIFGSLFSIITLTYAIKTQSGLPILLLSTMSGQIIAYLSLGVFLWYKGYFCIRGLFNATFSESPNLLQVGSFFFILQIGTMVGWGADPLLISNTLGASSVAVYSIVQRLFQFASQPLAIVNSPLWPAFADAYCRGDKAFIRKTLYKSLKISLIASTIICLILLVIANSVISSWTNGMVEVSSKLIKIYCLWTICEVIANAFAMFMNGCNIVRPQVFGLIVLITVSLPIKYILLLHFGIEAMLIGFIILFIINIVFWYGFVFRSKIYEVLM